MSLMSLHASLELRHQLQAQVHGSLCHHVPNATRMHLHCWPRTAALSGLLEQDALPRSVHQQAFAAREIQASVESSGRCNVVEYLALAQVTHTLSSAHEDAK